MGLQPPEKYGAIVDAVMLVSVYPELQTQLSSTFPEATALLTAEHGTASQLPVKKGNILDTVIVVSV